MKNIIHLYWIDKNRRTKGVGMNYNLVIDYDKKAIKTYIDPYYWYWRAEDVEVSKKSDIIKYEMLLEKIWFARI